MVTVSKDQGDQYWRVWQSGREVSKHRTKGAAVTSAKSTADQWDDYIEISGPRGGHERIDLKGRHGTAGGILSDDAFF